MKNWATRNESLSVRCRESIQYRRDCLNASPKCSHILDILLWSSGGDYDWKKESNEKNLIKKSWSSLTAKSFYWTFFSTTEKTSKNFHISRLFLLLWGINLVELIWELKLKDYSCSLMKYLHNIKICTVLNNYIKYLE